MDTEQKRTAVITDLTEETGTFRTVYIMEGDRHAVEMHPVPLTGPSVSPGDIFCGRVEKLLKSPAAAFVALSDGEKGFLKLRENMPVHYTAKYSKGEQMKEGDEILVQVEAGAVREKDAVLTSVISLKSTHLVLRIGGSGIFISRKLPAEKKEALRNALSGISREGYALTVRTNAADVPFEALRAEAADLYSKADALLREASGRKAPARLRQHAPSWIEDYLHPEHRRIGRVMTDIPEVYQALRDAGKSSAELPELLYYQDAFPLAALYSLSRVREEIMHHTVTLRSGATIILDATEAMYVIDVNTGSSMKKDTESREDYFLRINLEAAEAVSREIRLRNYSGMILVDFISMQGKERIHAVMEHLAALFQDDPVRTAVVDCTALGIVEITREKITSSVKQILTGHI